MQYTDRDCTPSSPQPPLVLVATLLLLRAQALHSVTPHDNKLEGQGKRLHGRDVASRGTSSHADATVAIAVPFTDALMHTSGSTACEAPNVLFVTPPLAVSVTHCTEHGDHVMIGSQYSGGQGAASQVPIAEGFGRTLTPTAAHGRSSNSSVPLRPSTHCTVRCRRPGAPQPFRHWQSLH
jgi:hypothetical protein